MKETNIFFDTNILLYLLSEDESKANQAEHLISQGGIISVQVLNEFTSVTSKKFQMSYDEIRDFLVTIRSIITVKPLDIETHELGLEIAGRYRFSFYDSLIVASSLLAGCEILYTEDLHHEQRIEGQLIVINPFL